MQEGVESRVPTIKGIFVMSHVKALEAAKGKEGVAELERRFGRPIAFGAIEDVPVRDEVAILEHALDIQTEGSIPKEEHSLEAGKLHFHNFSQTPLGLTVLPLLRGRLKTVFMHTNNVGGQVFRGVNFASQDIGEKAVKVTMENTDYPLEHFKGFFEAWLNYGGVGGTVEAKDEGDKRYTYTIVWY